MEPCLNHSRIIAPESAAKVLLVGAATVDISAIDWSNCSRQFDRKKVDYLKKKFESGCNRTEAKHYVDVMISHVQLQGILDASGFTLQDLKNSGGRGKLRRLKVPNSWKLPCKQGQHRLVAASEFFPKKKDQWWPVNVFAYWRFGKRDHESGVDVVDKFRCRCIQSSTISG